MMGTEFVKRVASEPVLGWAFQNLSESVTYHGVMAWRHVTDKQRDIPLR